ncbi:MAG TPA: antibiotic biosynthesis monooxygenase [Cyclobacteriaceae bacterium]|nr:antibiotic biosynthesis monooxygenase [Cyclobacteriaceae bacterium]
MNSKLFKAILICFFAMQIQSSFGQAVKRDLDKNIFIIVEAKIKPGQFDNFIKVAKHMSETVKANEAAALDYEWTITPDSSTCFILERYASSEGSLAHNKLFQEQFAAKFNEVLEFVGLTVYGNPSKELKEAFGPAGAASKVLVAGFAR